jgi:hypothetical protein
VGSKYKEGDTVIAPNGYKYIYATRDGKLTRTLYHHYVGFKKYGRWPREDEQVRFVDGNRRNFAQYNIEYRIKNHSRERNLATRQKYILERIAELQGEFAENAEELKRLRTEAEMGEVNANQR